MDNQALIPANSSQFTGTPQQLLAQLQQAVTTIQQQATQLQNLQGVANVLFHDKTKAESDASRLQGELTSLQATRRADARTYNKEMESLQRQITNVTSERNMFQAERDEAQRQSLAHKQDSEKNAARGREEHYKYENLKRVSSELRERLANTDGLLTAAQQKLSYKDQQLAMSYHAHSASSATMHSQASFIGDMMHGRVPIIGRDIAPYAVPLPTRATPASGSHILPQQYSLPPVRPGEAKPGTPKTPTPNRPSRQASKTQNVGPPLPAITTQASRPHRQATKADTSGPRPTTFTGTTSLMVPSDAFALPGQWPGSSKHITTHTGDTESDKDIVPKPGNSEGTSAPSGAMLIKFRSREDQITEMAAELEKLEAIVDGWVKKYIGSCSVPENWNQNPARLDFLRSVFMPMETKDADGMVVAALGSHKGRAFFIRRILYQFLTTRVVDWRIFIGFNAQSDKELLEIGDSLHNTGLTLSDRLRKLEIRRAAILRIIQHDSFDQFKSFKIKAQSKDLRRLVQPFLGSSDNATSAAIDIAIMTKKAFDLTVRMYTENGFYLIQYISIGARFNCQSMRAVGASEEPAELNGRRVRLGISPNITFRDEADGKIFTKTVALGRVYLTNQ